MTSDFDSHNTTTYPPPKHLLRDLGLEVTQHETGSTGTLPIVDELRTDAGSVRLGALATVADVVGGGLAAVTAAPDWMITSDLALHMTGDTRVDRLRVDGRVLRKGRTLIVLEIEMRGETEAPIALALLSFAVVPRSAVNPVLDVRSAPTMATALPDSGFRRSLIETVGLRVADAEHGEASLPFDPYVANSFGALQGGMIGLLADVSAEQALRAATGRPVVALDLQLSYLQLGRVGPFTTFAELDEVDTTHGAATVRVVDAGDDLKLMSVAQVRAGAIP